MKKPPSSQKAFTLIELLVVIAIIGILMALLFPAINGALNNARKATAKTDVVMIASAITAFENEYGKFPPGGNDTTGSSVQGDMLTTLMGQNTTYNPRGIVFLDIANAMPGKKSGYYDSGGGTPQFVDPWNPPKAYLVMMDINYKGSLPDPIYPSGNIRKHVLVYSAIPKISGLDNTNLRVNSWQ
ncbi:MAG: prepilin-type N-terminal cleavage/methylation domain-containing protein [Chthoniobacterales bacterium]